MAEAARPQTPCLPDEAEFREAMGVGVASRALLDVIRERVRQIHEEKWTAAHDDAHIDGSMATAAACYAVAGLRHAAVTQEEWPPRIGGRSAWLQWPWDWSWFKPLGRRRNLVRAGALILAEIERIDRADEAQRTAAAGHD